MEVLNYVDSVEDNLPSSSKSYLTDTDESSSFSDEGDDEQKCEDEYEPELTKELEEWLNGIYFVDDYVSEYFYQPDSVLEQDATSKRSITHHKHKYSQKHHYDKHIEKKIHSYFKSHSNKQTEKESFRRQNKKQTKMRRSDRLYKMYFQKDHGLCQIAPSNSNSFDEQKAMRHRMQMRQMRLQAYLSRQAIKKVAMATMKCPLCPYLHASMYAAAHVGNLQKYAFIHSTLDSYEMKQFGSRVKKVKILPAKNNPKASQRRSNRHRNN